MARVIESKPIEKRFDQVMERVRQELSGSEGGRKCVDGFNVYESFTSREFALQSYIRNYVDDDVHVSLHSISGNWTCILFDITDQGSKVQLGLGSAAILHKQRLFFFNSSNTKTADVTNYLYQKLVKDVALGDYHFVVLTDNREVHCYGLNNNGQLGVEDRSACYAKLDFAADFVDYLPMKVFCWR
ncbi:hypothetical protein GEMRC1_013309 [Eukaryota sp. GEM-RC1]